MESDINYPKSKAFNIFLRFFQLALSLGCTVFVAELVEKTCIDSQFRIIEILSGALGFLSLLAIIIIKCSKSHPKIGFAFLFLIALSTAFAIAFFSFKNIQENNCAVSKMLYQYYIGQSLIYVLISLSILALPLLWIQRYTNSPGNLIWPGLFLLFVKYWQGTFNSILILIPVIAILISIITFIANIFASFKGITTGVKKLIKFAWFFDLILMLANEAIAVRAYILGQEYFSLDFNGLMIKVLLQIFILVNIVDLIFWLYGYQTLSYENGDSVRDDLVKFGKNPQFDEESDVNQYQPEKRGDFGQIA